LHDACSRGRFLRANPGAAVTIDTETFPPEVFTIRGRIEITEADGIPAEYASAARRYLGEEAAREYLAQIDQPGINERALAVYTAAGYRPDGSDRVSDFRGTRARELRLVKQL
jgi:hypothetical protein